MTEFTPESCVQTLIIGFGNALRQDDGAGVRAAEALAQRLEDADCRVLLCHQLTLDLAEPISRARRVIFLDASVEGPPGTVRCRSIAPDFTDSAPSSHFLSPTALLSAAALLYGFSPEAVLYTIGGDLFGFSEELSPSVSASLPIVIQAILERISLGGPPDQPRIDCEKSLKVEVSPPAPAGNLGFPTGTLPGGLMYARNQADD